MASKKKKGKYNTYTDDILFPQKITPHVKFINSSSPSQKGVKI